MLYIHYPLTNKFSSVMGSQNSSPSRNQLCSPTKQDNQENQENQINFLNSELSIKSNEEGKNKQFEEVQTDSRPKSSKFPFPPNFCKIPLNLLNSKPSTFHSNGPSEAV